MLLLYLLIQNPVSTMQRFLLTLILMSIVNVLVNAQEQKDVDYNDLWRRGPEKIYYLLPDTIHPFTGKCHLYFLEIFFQ